MMLRTAKAALVAGVALAATAASAQSGAYHVYSCRTPSGQPAPADGWSGSIAPTGTFAQYVKNTCAEGGALVAALGAQAMRTANTDLATWAFGAPAGEQIASATVWRAGDTTGGGAINATYQFWLAAPAETNVFEECVATLGCGGRGEVGQPLSPTNRLIVPASNLHDHLYLNASCGGLSGYECKTGTGDANGYAAAVYLYAADIVLEQNAGPSAANVAGELASAPAVRGTSDVTFTASDPASGVYEGVFSVDGQVVQTSLVNENGGRCRDVGQTSDGRPAFLYVQPCLPSVSADVPFDTTSVGNGVHHLVVTVTDAAGNGAPVLDRQVTVANAPPACAPGAASVSSSAQAVLSATWRDSKKDRLMSPFGRTQTIVGRLTTPAGAPIAGVPLDLVATPGYAGAAQVAMAGAHTGVDGRFQVRVPGGLSSRTLCLSYRGAAAGAQAISRTLTLNVRAGVALGVSPKTASVGHSIFFRGHLRGGPVPSDGKQLVLEARAPGGTWIEFKVIRTGRRGRFRASYRFKFPGPAAYQFRVISEPESDYPFAAGSSNVVGVRER